MLGTTAPPFPTPSPSRIKMDEIGPKTPEQPSLTQQLLEEKPHIRNRNYWKVTTFILLGMFIASLILYLMTLQNQKVLDILNEAYKGANQPLISVTPFPTPTPDLAANWQTYHNEVFGYSFDYPTHLEVEDANEIATDPETSTAISVHLNPEWAGFDELYGNAFKVIISPKDSKSIEEIASNIWRINKEDKNPNKPQKVVGELEVLTFRGRDGYRFSVTSSFKTGSLRISSMGYGIDRENTVLLVDGKVFIYGIIFPSNTPLADQILSTFKFTD